MNLNPNVTPYIKLIWDRSQTNIKAKTAKLSGEKEKKSNVSFCKEFLERKQNMLITKGERNKFDFINTSTLQQ